MTSLVYSLVVVVVDQVTKHIARTEMNLHDSISILGDFFRLTYIENSGIAFGINFKGGTLMFTILASVATVVLLGYLWTFRGKAFPLRLSLALILGGAVGNLIDRLVFGKVVDFFHFSVGKYSWPIFNVADSCVTVGVLLFVYLSVLHAPGEKRVAS